MAYILVNKDNTVNYIGEELSKDIITDGLDVIHIDDGRSAIQLQNNIPPQYCVYDYESQTVVDERDNPEMVIDTVLDSLESQGEKAEYQRHIRKRLLKNVDIVLGNKLWFDSLSDDQKRQVYQYRQDLLDISKQKTFPEYVSWPDIPNFI